jgi:flagellar basal-body rod protein FlgF
VIAGVDTLLSGMQALWQRHEVLANNLANTSTTAFKRDDVIALPDSATAQTVASGLNLALVGTQPAIQYTDYTQGPIQHTGRNLDVALDGSGFFVVETPAGTRYTRSGAFNLGGDGALTTGDGYPVQGVSGPIVLRSPNFTITGQGEIRDGEQVIGALKIVDFPKPYQLLKEGSNLYVPAEGIAPEATTAQVVSGAVEGSNVNSVEAMVSMIGVLRSYEAAQKALQALEEANQTAANQIGTVV